MDYSSWMDGSVWGSFSLKLPQLGRVESSPSIALEYSDPTVFPSFSSQTMEITGQPHISQETGL